MATYSRELHPHVPENLLSLLERLTTFPTEPTELNKWWVEELGARPPKPKSAGKNEDEDEDDSHEIAENDDDATDDWRKFFDEQPTQDKSTSEHKGPGARLYKLTIHQSLHSLESHKAVFSRAWLALLPLLSLGTTEASKSLATRALNVMHRGVLPHLTRPLLVMDWVASCVDYGKAFTASKCLMMLNVESGGTVGLLALNALFILIKDYNLYVQLLCSVKSTLNPFQRLSIVLYASLCVLGSQRVAP